MITLGIAEDHKMFRETLGHTLEDDGDYEVVFQVKDGVDLLDKLNCLPMPDVILLDVKMPNIDGPTVVKMIREEYGCVPKILVLSMFKENALVLEMINNGANGYITKSIGFDELKKVITKVHMNGLYISPDISSYVSFELQHTKQVLKQTEIEILKLICKEHTNQEISDLLDIPLTTINTYRTRMIEKLGVKNSIGLVIYAIKCGIHWVEF